MAYPQTQNNKTNVAYFPKKSVVKERQQEIIEYMFDFFAEHEKVPTGKEIIANTCAKNAAELVAVNDKLKASGMMKGYGRKKVMINVT